MEHLNKKDSIVSRLTSHVSRIYLGDWLYNAGIVGFLKINNHLWEVKNEKLASKDEDLLKIEDNYIEINRKIFDGFTDRFFNYVFSLYSKYDEVLEHLRKLIDNLNDDAFKKINQDFNKILKDYPILKKKLEEEIGNLEAKDSQELSNLIENAIKIMEEDKSAFVEDFIQNDVRKFLDVYYGQKSFLNRGVKGSKREKFYKDFEEPLKLNNGESTKHQCVICGERPAKKGLSFNTGFTTVFGLNEDATNFLWDFDVRVPACEICEIIYLCSFAGLTKISGKHYFVNQDSTIESLFIGNGRFERELKKDYDENINDISFIKFISDFLISLKKMQSKYIIQNVNFIEAEIKKLPMSERKLVKVFNFNIDRKTAEFIDENHENFKSLSKSFFLYPNDETKVYILTEFLNSVLKKDLNYEFLYKIFRSRIGDKAFVSNNNLQRLIIMYLLYLIKIGGKEMNLKEGSLWAMHRQGQELLRRLKERNAENKIQSIAYKLLNALKIGDVGQFMDVMTRVCIAYNLEVPYLLTKALEDKDNFYLLGYSFLNGLLGKEYKKQEENQ